MRATGLRWEGESEEDLTEAMIVAHVGIAGGKGKVIDQVEGAKLTDEEEKIGKVESKDRMELGKKSSEKTLVGDGVKEA